MSVCSSGHTKQCAVQWEFIKHRKGIAVGFSRDRMLQVGSCATLMNTAIGQSLQGTLKLWQCREPDAASIAHSIAKATVYVCFCHCSWIDSDMEVECATYSMRSSQFSCDGPALSC